MRTRDDAIAKARASCRQFELLGFYLFLFLQTNSKYIQDLFTSSCKSLNSVKKCNDLFFLYSYCHAAFSQFFFVISTGHSEQNFSCCDDTAKTNHISPFLILPFHNTSEIEKTIRQKKNFFLVVLSCYKTCHLSCGPPWFFSSLFMKNPILSEKNPVKFLPVPGRRQRGSSIERRQTTTKLPR